MTAQASASPGLGSKNFYLGPSYTLHSHHLESRIKIKLFHYSSLWEGELWLNFKYWIYFASLYRTRFSFPCLIDFHLNQNTRWIETLVLLHYKHFSWNGNFPPLEGGECKPQLRDRCHISSLPLVNSHCFISQIFNATFVNYQRDISQFYMTAPFSWGHKLPFIYFSPGTQRLPCHKYHCSSLTQPSFTSYKYHPTSSLTQSNWNVNCHRNDNYNQTWYENINRDEIFLNQDSV